ncbi:MAG: DUF4855 domain-containing protein [Fibrobacterota bacterium]
MKNALFFLMLAFLAIPAFPGYNSFLNHGDSIPTDLALIYCGATDRIAWTADQFEPYVFRQNPDRTDWLFDGFLMIEFRTGTGYTYAPSAGSGLPARKSEWQQLLDKFFEPAHAVDALDSAVSIASERLEAPLRKRKVILTLPQPVRDQKDWGSLDGRTLDFSVSQDRIDACTWFIREAISQWDSLSPSNLVLAGFYWVAEDISQDLAILPAIASEIKSNGLKFSWIPYWGTGVANWASYGFDWVYQQPNYFFHTETHRPPAVASSRLSEACYYARMNGMGMEFEFDSYLITQTAMFAPRLDTTISFYSSPGFGVLDSSIVAYYMDSYCLLQLSQSTVDSIHKMYDAVADFVCARQEIANADYVQRTGLQVISFDARPLDSILEALMSTKLVAMAVLQDGRKVQVANGCRITSLDGAIAEVNRAVVTGKTPGLARLVLEFGTMKDTVAIEIIPSSAVLDSIRMNSNSRFLGFLDTFALHATGYYRNSQISFLKNLDTLAVWTSSDPSIATVARGIMVGVNPGGPIAIVAKHDGASDTCQVTVVATTTHDFIPVDDAYARGGTYAAQLFGVSDSSHLVVKSEATLEYTRQTYLKFDLRNLPAASLYSAKLSLYMSSSDLATPMSTALFEVVSNAWTEDALSWNNKPLVGKGLDTLSIAASTAGYREWEIPLAHLDTAVKADSFASFCLRDVISSNWNAIFNSKEQPANPPLLIIKSMTGSTSKERPGNEPSSARLMATPNPFNPSVNISYSLTRSGSIGVAIYSGSGRLIKMLEQGVRLAGQYSVIWDGTDLNNQPVASGVYVVNINALPRKMAKRISLIR